MKLGDTSFPGYDDWKCTDNDAEYYAEMEAAGFEDEEEYEAFLEGQELEAALEREEARAEYESDYQSYL